MKARITSILLIVVLAAAGGNVAAQETLPPLPQDRQPITPQNAANLELLATWRTGRIEGVTWLTDERMAVQESQHTSIYQLPDLDTPQAVIPVAGHALPSPDGNWLVFTESLFDHNKNTAIFWNTYTGNARTIPLSGVSYYFRVRDYSPIENRVGWSSGMVFFFASFETLLDRDPLLVIDLNKADDEAAVELLHPLSEQTHYEILHVVGTRDGKRLFTLSQAVISDQIVLLSWDLETGESQVVFETPFLPDVTWFPRGIQLDAGGREIALLAFAWSENVVNPPYVVRRWQIDTWEELPAYELPAGANIPGWNYAHKVYIRPYPGCQMGYFTDSTRTTPLIQGGAVDCRFVQFSDQGVLITTGLTGLIWYQWATGILTELEKPQYIDNNLLVLSPEGRRLAAVDINGLLYLWDMTDPSAPLVHDYRTPPEQWTDFAASPDGKKLIITGHGSVQEFDLVTGEQQTIIEGADNEFLATTYHPDGILFVIAEQRGALYFYDAQTLTSRFTLWGNSRPEALSFSADGRLLAVVAQQKIQIWDINSGKIINQLNTVAGVDEDVLFVEGDQWLVYGTGLWRIEDGGRLIAGWDWRDTESIPPTVLAYHLQDPLRIIGRDANQELILFAEYYSGKIVRLRSTVMNGIVWTNTSINLFANDRFYTPWSTADLTSDLLILGRRDGPIYFLGVREDAS